MSPVPFPGRQIVSDAAETLAQSREGKNERFQIVTQTVNHDQRRATPPYAIGHAISARIAIAANRFTLKLFETCGKDERRRTCRGVGGLSSRKSAVAERNCFFVQSFKR